MHPTNVTDRRPAAWQTVWRDALAPLLSTDDLLALHAALTSDDARIIQGTTTSPPPLACVSDWPCEGACAIGFVGMTRGLVTVGEVEEFFARMCAAIDQRLGQMAGCRWFLNHFDETPRDEMRRELLAEIARTLEVRPCPARR